MPYWYVALSRTVNLDSLMTLRRLADSAAQTALKLDPYLPEAHVASGVSQLLGAGTFGGAEAAFRRALELGAAPRAREHLANVLLSSGRPEEALAEIRRAAEDDPLSAPAAADLGRTLCFNGRYAEGMALLERVKAVRPPLQRTDMHIAFCHAMNRQWPQAIALMRDSDDDRALGFLGYFLARGGRSTEARRIQSDLIGSWGTTRRGAIGIAMIAAGLEDYDAAIEWLNRSDLDHWIRRGDIMYPLFDRLHRDSRFGEIVRRQGLQMR
jgi:serine/threonine-protein kinase